jgi:predicted ArsR family transcriptional regulator
MAALSSPARLAVLRLLKERGPMTAKAIARELGITPVAVHKHLEALEAGGLVEATVRRQPRGRPALVYQLSPRAVEVFPQGYRDLLIGVLNRVAELHGPDELYRLLASHSQSLRERYRIRLMGKDLVERVRELARIRDEEGYMAVAREESGGLVLIEHHCPIYEIAREHPEACRCEEELFTEILGTPVRREATLARGDPACLYRIEPRPRAAGRPAFDSP